jgi:hypothetical protein
MFKSIPLYIRLMRDKVEITNLNTGETASEVAAESFSTQINIVGKFYKSDKTITAALSELKIGGGLFPPTLKILIQQMEGLEGGLSDVEKRALQDLAELVGGKTVNIVEHSRRLADYEAIDELSKKSR